MFVLVSAVQPIQIALDSGKDKRITHLDSWCVKGTALVASTEKAQLFHVIYHEHKKYEASGLENCKAGIMNYYSNGLYIERIQAP